MAENQSINDEEWENIYAYEALSYEWGNSDQPFRILVCGEERRNLGYIPLTKNLFDALKDLRDSPGIESKRFWIDQICINQEDEDEKNRQVGLMADIYRNASQVTTYLGPHGEDMEQERGAFRLLAGLTEHFQPAIVKIEDALPVTLDVYVTPDLYPLRELPQSINSDNPYWIQLLRMVYSGWVYRVWMVQENVLCTRTRMLRGQQRSLWSSVGLKHNPYLLDCAVVSIWKLRREFRLGKQGTSQLHGPSLGTTIFDYSHLGCQDPRDRIFAVLGISSDGQKLGIVPKYQISERDIFIDTSIRIYTLSQELYLLNNIGLLDNLSDPAIPSWAYRNSQFIDGSIASSIPHPSMISSIRFEDQNTVLVTRGRVVDIVVSTTPPVPSNLMPIEQLIDEAADIHKAVLVSYTTILCHLGTSLETISSLTHASTNDASWPSNDTVVTAFYFWCTYISVANTLVEADATVVETPWFSEKVVPSLKQIREILKREGLDVHDDPTIAISPDVFSISSTYLARAYTRGRSISILEDKGVCNSSGKTREGDVVAILAGATTPYVLRPVGDSYQFVGVVWVEGLMAGEAYKDVDPQDVDYEIRLI